MACDRLYGTAAGAAMFNYYRLFEAVPDVPLRSNAYLPRMWNYVHAAPSHWRDVALDSKTWNAEITNEAYLHGIETLNLTRRELHRRLAHRWQVEAGLNAKGADLIDRALASQPLPQSVADLQFLKISLHIYQPFIEALEEFHTALHLHFSGVSDPHLQKHLEEALDKAKEAQSLAAQSFPHPVDPVGAEVGSLDRNTTRLVSSIQTWMNIVRKERN
jgi:hypothetical protein